MYDNINKEPLYSIGNYNKQTSYRLHLFNPHWIDVIFPEGSMYLTISPTPYGTPLIKAFYKVNKKNFAPIEACGEIEVGYIIISMNDEDITTLSFTDFAEKLKNAKRPLKFRFAKPEINPELHVPFPNRKGKVVEWKYTYIHLPIKVIDLTSFPVVPQSKRIVSKTLDEEMKRKKNLTLLNNLTNNTTSLSDDSILRQSHQNRISQVKNALKPCTPNGYLVLDQVRNVAFTGIPEDSNFRSFYWMYLLGCLSDNYHNWENEEIKLRDEYNGFVKDLIIDRNDSCDNHGSMKLSNPLASNWSDRQVESKNENEEKVFKEINRKWTEQYNDELLREDIWKDINRTFSKLHFFDDNVRDILARILYIYAQLNPGVKYVQGMNEILAPLYYVFANRKLDTVESETINDSLPHSNSESITFTAFNKIMGELKDLYINVLDNTQIGISAILNKFEEMISRHIPQISKVFKSQNIQCQLYALRWFTTLFSREFELPDTIRLWDTIFSDPKRERYEMLFFISLALLDSNCDQLLQNDFTTNITLLQSLSSSSIEDIIHKAMYFRDQELIHQYLVNKGVPIVMNYNPIPK